MYESKVYAVINNLFNIELVMAHSEIEAAQLILKIDKLEKLSEEEVEKGVRNIEAMCHEICLESAITFNYAYPDSDLITTALAYDKTVCFGISKEMLN